MKPHRTFVRLLAFAFAWALLLSSPAIAEAGTGDLPERAEDGDLRIMCYNLMHPDWSRVPVAGRDETVASILRLYRPDVVAVQEAGAKWHKALIPLLTEPGDYAFACRQSNADGFIYCTTCFLYNPQTVEPVEEYILDLEYKHATRVFAVAVFERRSDGARFAVANTHPAPREEPREYARNMADLTSCAVDLMKKYPDLPVIIAGDFNTPEQAEEYQNFMREANVKDAKYEADVLVRGCSTFFGYQVAPDADDTSLCIDHLFVNGKTAVRRYEAVTEHGVQNASDHIPIYIDIGLRQAAK